MLIIILGVPLFIIWVITCVDLQSNGFFFQTRIGQYGKPFTIIKLKSMHPKKKTISKWGRFLRKSKWDEVPQLYNILKGDMSVVGPRPDIQGYYDKLKGEERKILELKPGLTCEASLKYANEEYLLAQQENPLEYNDTVLFPDKVKMNLDYYYNRTFFKDLLIVMKTIKKVI